LAGLQKWTYVEGSGPNAQFASDGTGQATLVFDGQFTTLTLYNNELDADGTENLEADFQLRFQGHYDETNFQLTVLDTAKAGTQDAFQGAIFFG
jgi:hypothetical protein